MAIVWEAIWILRIPTTPPWIPWDSTLPSSEKTTMAASKFHVFPWKHGLFGHKIISNHKEVPGRWWLFSAFVDSSYHLCNVIQCMVAGLCRPPTLEVEPRKLENRKKWEPSWRCSTSHPKFLYSKSLHETVYLVTKLQKHLRPQEGSSWNSFGKNFQQVIWVMSNKCRRVTLSKDLLEKPLAATAVTVTCKRFHLRRGPTRWSCWKAWAVQSYHLQVTSRSEFFEWIWTSNTPESEARIIKYHQIADHPEPFLHEIGSEILNSYDHINPTKAHKLQVLLVGHVKDCKACAPWLGTEKGWEFSEFFPVFFRFRMLWLCKLEKPNGKRSRPATLRQEKPLW